MKKGNDTCIKGASPHDINDPKLDRLFDHNMVCEMLLILAFLKPSR